MSKIIGNTVTTPIKPSGGGGSIEQEGIFEVVRDVNSPAIKVGKGTEIGEIDYGTDIQNVIKLADGVNPCLIIKTKDGVNIMSISPSQWYFLTGNFATIGQLGNNNFVLSLSAGKVRTNTSVATDNTFAVGWETWEGYDKSYNPFEVISDFSTGKCGIKVGQTALTEEQLKSMLSILTNDLSEVTY